MFHRQTRTAVLPVTDYQAAIASAREWLGDRYLLAQPVNGVRRTEPFQWRPQRG